MNSRMTKALDAAIAFIFAFSALCANAAGQVDQSRLQRYLEIVDRKPFGEVLPPDEAPAEAQAQTKTVAENLLMRAIIDDGVTVRVGFLDKQQQKNIYLTLGEVTDGLELVSVDYDNESAVLRRGQETSVFMIKPEGAAARMASDLTPVATSSAAPVPAPRRRPFFTNLAKQTPPDIKSGGSATPYRGKTIEDFLRENPDAAMKYPSPLRPVDSSEPIQGKGETIEKFLRENQDAVQRFSPFQTVNPSAKVEGRGETVDRFIGEHSEQLPMPVLQPIILSPESVPFLFEGIPEEEFYYE